MSRYLFITNSGKVEDGGHVLNHELTTSLARQGHEVHLLMLGASETERPGVVAHDVRDPRLPAQEESRIEAALGRYRFPVDRLSVELAERFPLLDRASKGLPTDPSAFTAVVGFGDVTGPAALDIRSRFYPGAVAVNGITMDPEGLFKVIDAPELGASRIAAHRATFAGSDLLFAHGIKSERDALRLTASHPGTETSTPVYSFLPGTQISDSPAWNGEGTMNVLMLGRMGDPNKGAVDTAMAVGELRSFEGRDITLTLRGVSSGDMDALSDTMEQHVGPEWRTFVQVEPFTDSAEEKARSIHESHAMVMATESEAYGLAANEYLAHGKPLLVAEGNGNGYAEVLKSWEGMPETARSGIALDPAPSEQRAAADTGGSGPPSTDRAPASAQPQAPSFLGKSTATSSTGKAGAGGEPARRPSQRSSPGSVPQEKRSNSAGR